MRYPDNRGKFKGIPQWSVDAASSRGDNLVKNSEPVTTKASRGISPRDAFRVSTTEDEKLLMQQAEAEALKAREAEIQKGISSLSVISVPDGSTYDLYDTTPDLTVTTKSELGSSIDDVMGSEDLAGW